MAAALPARPKTQAPIFRRRPELLPPERGPDLPAQAEIIPDALVTPFGVFVAGRKTFDCILRAKADKQTALPLIFAFLPLTENGWHLDQTEIEYVCTRDGFSVWRLTRSE